MRGSRGSSITTWSSFRTVILAMVVLSSLLRSEGQAVEHRAEPDDVPFLELAPLYPLVVHVGAVRASFVGEKHDVLVDVEGGVKPRDAVIVDDDVAIVRPPDGADPRLQVDR